VEDQEMLGGELRQLLGALDVSVATEGVHPVVPIEEHRLRTDVLGEALRMCEAIARGETVLEHVEAGDLVGAGSADPVALRAYVRRLLTGTEGDIAALLLEDPTS
jgi:hypothetical protein